MPFALCKNVLAIGSRRLTFDGETTLLHSSANFFTDHTTVFYAAASTGWNRRIFLLKLFNISVPASKEVLKHTSARTVHAKVIVKPARVLKFDFFMLRGSVKI